MLQISEPQKLLKDMYEWSDSLSLIGTCAPLTQTLSGKGRLIQFMDKFVIIDIVDGEYKVIYEFGRK